MTHSVRVERATAKHATALQQLFATEHSGCYCRWWSFEGDKNAWQLRCADGSENASELGSQLSRSAPDAHGFVALRSDDAVGWLKLSAAEHIPKLYQQRLYRGLPCFQGERAGVYTVGCMLVAADSRRRGVATALLAAAIDWARRCGARAIEAFPRRAEQVHEAELWLGPTALYERAGFVVVHDFAPYPVLRLEL